MCTLGVQKNVDSETHQANCPKIATVNSDCDWKKEKEMKTSV